jgi:hypothetical protein
MVCQKSLPTNVPSRPISYREKRGGSSLLFPSCGSWESVLCHQDLRTIRMQFAHAKPVSLSMPVRTLHHLTLPHDLLQMITEQFVMLQKFCIHMQALPEGLGHSPCFVGRQSPLGIQSSLWKPIVDMHVCPKQGCNANIQQGCELGSGHVHLSKPTPLPLPCPG